MKLGAFSGTFVLVAGSLLQPTAGRAASTVPDCAGIISAEEIRRNDYISFHDGRVRRIDLKEGLLALDLDGKHYGIYFNANTQICNAGKPGTLRDLKVGDKINGFTKIIQGRSVAVVLGFGEIFYPSAIPVPGREGWVRSPYAPSKPAINVTGVPDGALVQCPYTGKTFKNLAPSKS